MNRADPCRKCPKCGIRPPLQSFVELVFGVRIVLRQQQHIGEIEVGFDVVLIRLESRFKLLLGLCEVLPA